MVDTNNLKKGLVVKIEDRLYEIIDHFHYKPGKGQAFVKAKLRDVMKGGTVEKKFRSGEKLQDVFVDKKTMFFSYIDEEQYVFMDTETYEQENLSKDVLGENLHYLVPDQEVIIKKYESQIIGIELPVHISLEVTYTEPAVKGDTATGANKPITLETGYTVQAPLFINIGDKVKIDTRNGEYVERA